MPTAREHFKREHELRGWSQNELAVQLEVPDPQENKERCMKRKRYLLPFLLLAVIALLIPVALGAGILLVQNRSTKGTVVGALGALGLNQAGQHHLDKQEQRTKQPPAVNMDCTLIVPANPLSAQGLATPYQLTATNPANGPCNESNKAQAAFVQGAIIDPASGAISIYNPLVVDQGTQPAVEPQPPFGGQIPPGDSVALWFGSNGNTLTLQESNGSLGQGQCVNGSNGSIFGQVAYCNAPAFFQATDQAIQEGKLVPPPLGTALDGQPCPTTRDFSIVDQDPSDNVTTTYLVTASGQTAQDTQINLAALGSQVQKNGSDERLLTLVDAALGCMPWMAPDLANPGHMVPALPLNELQAATSQGMPVALVPNADPMVLVNNQPDLAKLNAYRAGVDQPFSPGAQASRTRTFCQHLLHIAPGRLLLDEPLTRQAPPADPAVANSLFTFLAQRFVTTYEANGLNCMKRLNQPDPVTVTTDANGVTIDATISVPGIPSPTGMSFDCVVNGIPLAGCTGTAMINGQACSFALDGNTRKITITCPVGV